MPLELTAKQLADIWEDGNAERQAMDKRQRYYDGQHDITGRDEEYPDGRKKTNRVANYVKKLERFVGAMTATPFQVSSRDEEAKSDGMDAYSEIVRDQDIASQDVENLRRALVHGRAIEVHEFVDNEIAIHNEDVRQWRLIWDSDGNMVGAIRRATLAKGTIHGGKALGAELEVMTFYNDLTITDYEMNSKSKEWGEGKPTTHHYGAVPIVIWQVNNNGESVITDDLIGLSDEFNEILSAMGDNIRSDTDSILMLRNIDSDWLYKPYDPKKPKGPTNAEMSRLMRVYSVGENGDIKFVTKNLEVTREKFHLESLKTLIHTALGIPDEETMVGAVGRTSGIALKLKFMPMQHRANAMMHYLKKSIRERIDLINSVHAKTSKPQIEDYETTIQFILPVNRIEEWQNIGHLDNQVSHKDRLKLLSDVSDPDKALEAFRLEQFEGRSSETTALENEAVLEKAAREMRPAMEALLNGLDDLISERLGIGGAENV